MTIIASDLVMRLSTTSGSAGDTTASTPAASLGKYVSSTAFVTATLANLFRQITAAEALAGITLYRCVFILNNTAGGLTLQSPTISVQSETALGGSFALATDNIAAGAKGSSSAQAALIASETTPPTGVSAFGAGPLSLTDLAPGTVRGVWVRYTVPAATAAINPDGAIFATTGDTLP